MALLNLYTDRDRQTDRAIKLKNARVFFLFQKSKLRGVIDIFEGHFCRRLTERDAATFDLSNESLKDTFYGVLDVILHAASTSQSNQPIDVPENMAIMVKKVSKIRFYMNIHE